MMPRRTTKHSQRSWSQSALRASAATLALLCLVPLAGCGSGAERDNPSVPGSESASLKTYRCT